MPVRSAAPVRIPPTRGRPAAAKAKKARPKGGRKRAAARRAGAARAAGFVPYYKQLQSNWCWAACAQMVAESSAVGLAPSPDQPAIVTGLVGAAHNVTATGPQIVQLYGLAGVWGRGIACSHVANYLTQAALDAELAGGVPVECGLLWAGGGGHVVLVVAAEFDPATGGTTYTVHDSIYGVGRGSYTWLTTAYGRGRWSESFGQFA